jgi:hypothetical protein
MTRIPGIHRALGHAVGMGVRPEHVHDRRRERRARPRIAVLVGVAAGVMAAFVVLSWRR